MLITLESRILEKYPHTAIGYLMADVTIRKTDSMVENLKRSLKRHLQKLNLNATNFVTHPSISLWREIYETDFGVKAKTYRSSIEALLRRVATDKELWNINNIVDLYNCCSILSLLPMGGYDLDKIRGNIHIRYAQQGETFLSLGERQRISTSPHHVIYADDQNILCWLWNHKDAAITSITDQTRRVIFFIDSFDTHATQNALHQLADHLKQINCAPHQSGVLNRSNPSVNLC